jgi:hypothetical protein
MRRAQGFSGQSRSRERRAPGRAPLKGRALRGASGAHAQRRRLRGNATDVPPGGMGGEGCEVFENKTDLTTLEFILIRAHIGFEYGGVGMPLTGSIPKGGTFFCPHCGALYSVTHSRLSKSDSNIAKCLVCLQIMDKWVQPTFRSTSSSSDLKIPNPQPATSLCAGQFMFLR